ncbi:MAG: pilus assembly protein PilP [Proteobacteria bacterium]|nr:pilus assembly protein PilP [Pseudomonadota bacterium]
MNKHYLWLKTLFSLSLLAVISFFVVDRFALSQDDDGYEDSYEDDYDYEDEDEYEDSESEDEYDSPVEMDDVSSDFESSEIESSGYKYVFSLLGDDEPFTPAILVEHLEIEATTSTFESSTFGEPGIEELEKYSLSAIKLAGVWKSADIAKGLVVLPDGQGLVVKVGDKIGRHGGEIIEINNQELVVRKYTMGPENLRQVQDESILINSESSSYPTRRRGPNLSSENEGSS